MKNNKTIRYLLSGFLVLLLVSVYRQVSMRYMPRDVVRPYIVYCVYLVLLAGWGYSIRERIEQTSMRVCLYLQDMIMVLWVTVRFIQEAFIYHDIYLMRVTGYLINIPAVLIPLLSFYASLGLGQTENHHIQKKWYLLMLPAFALIGLALTDSVHHFMYYIIPEEPQPNLYFHPYIGLYLIFAWVLFCITLRIIVIYHKHRGGQESTVLIRRVAFIEPLLLILFSVPYVLSSFSIRIEIVEYSVGMFSMIVLAWEMYILLGLVPVNMQYPSVFEHSTIALQILDKEGNCLIRSKYNYQIDEDMFHQLCEEKSALLAEGKELNLTPIKSGYAVWSKDVYQMMDVVEKLSENVERLEKENTLKRQEINIRSEEVALNEKNKLYDQLSEEVGTQLELVEQKLQERNTRQDTERLFGEICYIGTYIKRRSNFRIVEQEEGSVCREDIELVLRDLTSNLCVLGIPCEVVWEKDICPTGQCFLRSIDALEEELEKADFQMQYLKLSYLSKREFQLECQFTDEKRSMRYGDED